VTETLPPPLSSEELAVKQSELREAAKTLHRDGFRARRAAADGSVDVVVDVRIQDQVVESIPCWRRPETHAQARSEQIRAHMLADAMCRFQNMGGTADELMDIAMQFDQFHLDFDTAGAPELAWADYFESTHSYVFGWPALETFVRVSDGDFAEVLTPTEFEEFLQEAHGAEAMEQTHNDLQFAVPDDEIP
jgi:hypothetical protein